MKVRPTLVALLLVAGCGGHGVAAAGSPRSPGGPVARGTPPTPTPARMTGARCADLVVLGLRGQGQALRADRGVGREVRAAVRSLVAHLRDGTTVRLHAVRYPAGSDATYDADVATGVRLITATTTALARSCPRTRVAVIGFSEGAQVAHLAAARTPFALAVLLGDPLRNPRLDVRTISFGVRLDGRGNAGYGPSFADPGRVLEVCAAADNVCNAPLTGRVGGVSATHCTVYERPAVARTVGAAAVGALS